MPHSSAIVSILSLLVALLSIVIAVVSLRMTRGLNRAKFLYDLHRDFFVAETYKNTLDILDEPSGDKRIAELLHVEAPELLGLLNAFELVAYFVKTKQLKAPDADALLGYYLGCIPRHPGLRRYIKENSFQHLDALLAQYQEKSA
jgi:hypothetical protein